MAQSRRQFLRLATTLTATGMFRPEWLAAGANAAGDSALAAVDIGSDTWAGVDALGRPLPTTDEAGPPRLNTCVGMFYFLTFDRNGDGPYDNTRILRAHPEARNDADDPAWGPLNSSHYWGEPLFGYYVSDDEYVLRKHAVMLVNAGVDVVIFDNSNAVTYDRARNALCRVWQEMRRQGNPTPQIAFLCPFGNPDNIGTATLSELYDSLYGPGLYPDLWFRWQGKPLVLADPSYADSLAAPTRLPTELGRGGTLGQSFTALRPFQAVGGEFPTWAATGSGVTLSLYNHGPGGRLRAHRVLTSLTDNALALLELGHPLPAGQYYLEMSQPIGRVGWWGVSRDVYAGGGAFQNGSIAPGDRSLSIRYLDAPTPQALSPDPQMTTPEALAAHARLLRQFFTFRTPIAPYNVQTPPPASWAWLQVFPQAPQRDAAGQIEQVSVGVAQNYNAKVNSTAPMSFPGAFGRSYHQGAMDTRPGAVRWGYNFAEQWQRARQLDPPFVFVTGWNEWTAGFYREWAGFHAPPPIFVDEFTEEYSRDIEPMTGGHGDDYYYQLVNEVRRYKGVRPLPPVSQRRIVIDGRFHEWSRVGPEFRHARRVETRRDAPGVGGAGPYVNRTGRNSIVAAKVAYDADSVYFYVRTAEDLSPHTDPDWMLLYLNADADYRTGWLGYDFVVNRHVAEQRTSLERNVGGAYRWQHVADVKYAVRGREMELSVPRALLGLTSLPATIDFKWADHCHAQGDWTDFTRNGDAAPDDRFNYRAKLQNAPESQR